MRLNLSLGLEGVVLCAYMYVYIPELASPPWLSWSYMPLVYTCTPYHVKIEDQGCRVILVMDCTRIRIFFKKISGWKRNWTGKCKIRWAIYVVINIYFLMRVQSIEGVGNALAQSSGMFYILYVISAGPPSFTGCKHHVIGIKLFWTNVHGEH